MTNDNYDQKIEELDRLLNDPDVPMQPTLIWRLVGEISKHEANTTRFSAGASSIAQAPRWTPECRMEMSMSDPDINAG